MRRMRGERPKHERSAPQESDKPTAIRYVNLPVFGFKNTDAVTAAALVATF